MQRRRSVEDSYGCHHNCKGPSNLYFLKTNLILYAATGHSQSRGVSVQSKQTHSREGENSNRDTLETSSHDVDTAFLSLQCPSSQHKDDLLVHLDRMRLHTQQLKITSRVTLEQDGPPGETVS